MLAAAVHVVLLVFHLLAAAVWVGGTVVLVFVAVPVVRRFEGEARATLLREVGRRWRPLGWGALGTLVLTGLLLADEDGGFRGSFGAVLAVKVTLVALLIGAAAAHDFVLGPRLAAQIRAGGQQTSRPALVLAGWTSFVLTLAVPVLGVALAELG